MGSVYLRGGTFCLLGYTYYTVNYKNKLGKLGAIGGEGFRV